MRKIIGLFSVLTLLLTGCKSSNQPSAANNPVPVTAATPAVKDVTLYVETIGTLHPSVYMEIKPQNGGQLLEIFVQEGQWVEKGTPLFLLDPKSAQTRVHEAEAQLTIDRATHAAISKKLGRFKDLADKDLMAQVEWDELEAQAQKSQATVDLTAARYQNARNDLEGCTICARITGRIGQINGHSGQHIAGGQHILTTLSDSDPLLVEFMITEKEFSRMPNEKFPIEINCLTSDTCRKGSVTYVDNRFDSKTGLLLIRGTVENHDKTLRPGQTVQVRIPVTVARNVKVIPQRAIKYNQQGPYVYVISEDKTVSLRPLVLGVEQGTDQIVLEGLDANERFVVDGHLRVQPGQIVDIKS